VITNTQNEDASNLYFLKIVQTWTFIISSKKISFLIIKIKNQKTIY
jgi:hypothetical protein